MKHRWEFNHGFTKRGNLHCAILKALHIFQEERAQKSRNMHFVPQNIQNEVFNIFKMFKNNMKLTRVSCWINSNVRNKDKITRLIIFLLCHYCWSLLWCNYWKSLKSESCLPKKILYLLQWKLFKINGKCY